MSKGRAESEKRREQRAKGIAALELVERDGCDYLVRVSPFDKRDAAFQVSRTAEGHLACTCSDYIEAAKLDANSRCLHIIAVGFAIEHGQVRKSRVSADRGTLATRENRMSKRNQKKVEANEQAQTSDAPAVSNVIPLTFVNILRTLKQPVDSSLVKTREGWTDRSGNLHMVEYVEWHAVADILDRVAPTWSHSVRSVRQIGDIAVVTAAITIDGITREGVGTGTADSEMGIKKAEHDALKRAAVKFGIARELYQRESDVIEKEGTAPSAREFPRDPLAKSMADLVTPKQLGMIRAIGREMGVDVEEECQTVLSCKTDELSKRAASSFIDHLKQKQGAATGNQQRRRAS